MEADGAMATQSPQLLLQKLGSCSLAYLGEDLELQDQLAIDAFLKVLKNQKWLMR